MFSQDTFFGSRITKVTAMFETLFFQKLFLLFSVQLSSPTDDADPSASTDAKDSSSTPAPDSRSEAETPSAPAKIDGKEGPS